MVYIGQSTCALPQFSIHLPSSLSLDELFQVWSVGIRQGLGWELRRSSPMVECQDIDSVDVDDSPIPTLVVSSVHSVSPSRPQLPSHSPHGFGYNSARVEVSPSVVTTAYPEVCGGSPPILITPNSIPDTSLVTTVYNAPRCSISSSRLEISSQTAFGSSLSHTPHIGLF